MSESLKRVNESKLKILQQWHVKISKESQWFKARDERMSQWNQWWGWEKDVTPPSQGRLKIANPNFA